MGGIVKNDSPIVKAIAREEEADWQKYQAIATAGGIPAKRLQWYENWAKKFVGSIHDVPLPERTAEHVQSFLASLSRQPALQPWQVKQAGMPSGFCAGNCCA